MYSIRRIEYILLIFLKVKPSYSCQCAYLTLLMLYLFLYNAEMDILRRKVYADVGPTEYNIKALCLLRDPLCLLRRLAIYYCIAFVTRTIFRSDDALLKKITFTLFRRI